MIDNNLSIFKSSGVKYVTQSNNNTQANEVVSAPFGTRMLIGNFQKGPVNKPIYVTSFAQFRSIFGDISKVEERKGCWAKRGAFHMLEVSPIYVMNLRSFDDTKDKTTKVELSGETITNNGDSEEIAYSSLFDKKQFWNKDADNLYNANNVDKILSLANVSDNDMSVFIVKSNENITDQTFKNYYSNLSKVMPEFLIEDDKVSDYYVDVYIFNKNFGIDAYTNNSYGYLFNEDGTLKTTVVNEANQTVSALSMLANISDANYSTKITGCVVPDFTDASNNVQDIVQLINQTVDTYGLLAYLNEDLMDDIQMWVETDDDKKKPTFLDMKGHSICGINATTKGFDLDIIKDQATQKIEMLSYVEDLRYHNINQGHTVDLSNKDFIALDPTGNEVEEPNKSSIVKYNHTIFNAVVVQDGSDHKYNIGDKNKFFVLEDAKPNVGDTFASEKGNLVNVTEINYKGQTKQLKGYGTHILPIQPYNLDGNVADSQNWDDANGDASGYQYTSSGVVFPKDSTGKYYIYPTGHPIATDLNSDPLEVPLVFKEVDGITYVVHNPKTADEATYFYQKDDNGAEIKINFSNINASYVPDTEQLIESIDIDIDRVISESTVKYNALVNNNSISVNVYEVVCDGNLIVNSTDANGSDSNTLHSFDEITVTGDKPRALKLILVDGSEIDVYDPSFSDPTKFATIFKVNAVTSFAEKFNPITLTSYKQRRDQFVDGTAERQNEILNVLLEKDMLNSLSNLDLINFNYLVDGFKTFIEPNAKNQLKIVANERILCKAICNAPSIRDFEKSTNPYFAESVGGSLEVRFIPLGGNRQLPYTNTFSLPKDKSWNAYFYGPNLVLNNANKNHTMPPSMIVSNNFARKYLVGENYRLVSGAINGLVTGTGVSKPEHIFMENNRGTGDRAYLEPFGYNPIIVKSGSMQIYGNRTAFSSVSKEAPLSAIHTSEAVMNIQYQIGLMLEPYILNDYNTEVIRKNIETRANAICQQALQTGAIGGFRNIVSEENNTADVINARMLVLDTILLSSSGIEIAVHRTTVNPQNSTTTFESTLL